MLSPGVGRAGVGGSQVVWPSQLCRVPRGLHANTTTRAATEAKIDKLMWQVDGFGSDHRLSLPSLCRLGTSSWKHHFSFQWHFPSGLRAYRMSEATGWSMAPAE